MSRFGGTFFVLLFAACGSDPEGASLGDQQDDVGGSVTQPESCGPVPLCERSTGECGYAVTVETCASWYDDPANCADMDGYVACNCDCIDEDTCDSYYACGEICFADHC